MLAGDRWIGLYLYYAPLPFYRLDWTWLLAQMLEESRGDPHAVSPVGARGLAQWMPDSWREWHDGVPGFDAITDLPALLREREEPDVAARAQCAYLRWLLDRPGVTDYLRAFAAYNWGVGRFTRAANMKRLDWRGFLPRETRDYLTRIETQHTRIVAQLVPELRARFV